MLSRCERIELVISNSWIINKNKVYYLKDLYKIVYSIALLYKEDCCREDNGDIPWKHSLRTILEKCVTKAGRIIQYRGWAKYVFN